MTWNILKFLQKAFWQSAQPSEEAPKFYDKPTVVVEIDEFGKEVKVYIQKGNEKTDDIRELFQHLQERTKDLEIKFHYSMQYSLESTQFDVLSIKTNSFTNRTFSLKQGREDDTVNERAGKRLPDTVKIIAEKWAHQNGYDFDPIDKRPLDSSSDPYISPT